MRMYQFVVLPVAKSVDHVTIHLRHDPCPLGHPKHSGTQNDQVP